jgi:hypothetical protein
VFFVPHGIESIGFDKLRSEALGGSS